MVIFLCFVIFYELFYYFFKNFAEAVSHRLKSEIGGVVKIDESVVTAELRELVAGNKVNVFAAALRSRIGFFRYSDALKLIFGEMVFRLGSRHENDRDIGASRPYRFIERLVSCLVMRKRGSVVVVIQNEDRGRKACDIFRHSRLSLAIAENPRFI